MDKIIEEGYKYLHELRDVNIRIPDEVMTKRIDRMEVASADIFAYIAEHPGKCSGDPPVYELLSADNAEASEQLR